MTQPLSEFRSPSSARRRLDQLTGAREAIERSRAQKLQRISELTTYLSIAAPVEEALDKLSQQLFGHLITAIEQQLSLALQEVLDQPLSLKVEREFKRGAISMSFHIERDGQPEDIMRGQGGSVANVLSVGLRMLALTTLDKTIHRRLLVLDEQDCWLRPDLVPRLVRIVRQAGSALGFQVILISHHDVLAFEQYADRVYRFTPTTGGVSVRPVHIVGQADPPADPTQP
jgi:DNA repair exonuclease SbcCD ATPase subunit